MEESDGGELRVELEHASLSLSLVSLSGDFVGDSEEVGLCRFG